MKKIVLYTTAILMFLAMSNPITAQTKTEATNTKKVSIGADKEQQPEQKKTYQKQTKTVKHEQKSGTLQTQKKGHPQSKSGSSKVSTGPAGSSHNTNSTKPQHKDTKSKGMPSKGNTDHSVKVQADGKTVKVEQKENAQTQKPVLSTGAKKVEQTQKTVKSTKSKIQTAQAKIDYARKLVQESYDAKKITEDEYKEKMALLDEYEKKMLDLKKETNELTTEMKDEITAKKKELDEAHRKGEISDEDYQQKKAELDKLESNYYNSLYNKNKQKRTGQSPSSGKVTKQPE
jgi:uncharacterized membrane protein